jgi:hypothetical protein
MNPQMGACPIHDVKDLTHSLAEQIEWDSRRSRAGVDHQCGSIMMIIWEIGDGNPSEVTDYASRGQWRCVDPWDGIAMISFKLADFSEGMRDNPILKNQKR